MKLRKLLIALVVALLTSIFGPGLFEIGSGEVFYARVTAVYDGDTLTVKRAGRSLKVRLYGIDCPERSQSFGAEALAFSQKLVLNRRIQLIVMDQDRYGRAVALVKLDSGDCLNYELVSEGLAWWYQTYAPDELGLAVREGVARLRGRGLWVQKRPLPPWKYRKRSSKY